MLASFLELELCGSLRNWSDDVFSDTDYYVTATTTIKKSLANKNPNATSTEKQNNLRHRQGSKADGPLLTKER